MFLGGGQVNEVFNLFSEATVLQREHQLGIGTSDHVQEILSPRVFRVALRLNLR